MGVLPALNNRLLNEGGTTMNIVPAEHCPGYL